jgi:hypothetical protein
VVQETGGVITWEGGISVADPVVIQFNAQLDDPILGLEMITNTAVIDGDALGVLTREAGVVVNGEQIYLPFGAR